MPQVEYVSKERDVLGQKMLQVVASSRATRGYGVVQYLLGQELDVDSASHTVTATSTLTGKLKVIVSFNRRPGGLNDDTLKSVIGVQVKRAIEGNF